MATTTAPNWPVRITGRSTGSELGGRDFVVRRLSLPLPPPRAGPGTGTHIRPPPPAATCTGLVTFFFGLERGCSRKHVRSSLLSTVRTADGLFTVCVCSVRQRRGRDPGAARGADVRARAHARWTDLHDRVPLLALRLAGQGGAHARTGCPHALCHATLRPLCLATWVGSDRDRAAIRYG